MTTAEAPKGHSRLPAVLAARLALVPPMTTVGDTTIHEVVFLFGSDGVAVQCEVRDSLWVPLPQEEADDLSAIVQVVTDPLIPRVTADVFDLVRREMHDAATLGGGEEMVILVRDRVQLENPLVFEWITSMVLANADHLPGEEAQTAFYRACYGSLLPIYVAIERQARVDANARLKGEGPIRDPLALALSRLVEAQSALEQAQPGLQQECDQRLRPEIDAELLAAHLEKVEQVLADVAALRKAGG